MIFSRSAVGALYAIFAIIATFANLGVLIIILTARKLRNNGIYISAIGLAIVELVNGCFFMSARANLKLFGSSFANPGDVHVATLYTEYIFTALAMYILVFMFVNYIDYKKNNNKQKLKMMGIVGTLGTMIIITVSLTVTLHLTIFGSRNLATPLETIRIIIWIYVYFLPLILLFVSGLIIKIKHDKNRLTPTTVVNGMEGEISEPPPQFPSHLLVAGFIASFTAGPFVLLHLAPEPFCDSRYCEWYSDLWIVFTFLLNSQAILLPFAWLLEHDYISSLKTLFCCGNAHQQLVVMAPMTDCSNTPMISGFPGQQQQQSTTTHTSHSYEKP